jgi:hypothetical protein
MVCGKQKMVTVLSVFYRDMSRSRNAGGVQAQCEKTSKRRLVSCQRQQAAITDDGSPFCRAAIRPHDHGGWDCTDCRRLVAGPHSLGPRCRGWAPPVYHGACDAERIPPF